ncbi:MAG: Yip1 family protein [Mangrovibacterium sp.]
MNLTERVKNIVLTPKSEWRVIETENDPHAKVLTTYLIWLALIPAVAAFIGYGLIGYQVFGVKVGGGVSWGIRFAVQHFISVIGGAYLTAWVFDLLAPNFGGTKNFDRAFQLAAYCYTPVCVGGIFYLHHSLSVLAGLAGLYGLYLLYLGIKPMMKAPDDKLTTYFIIALLAMIVISLVLGSILGVIIGVSSPWR